jgi:hypothetical protein
MVAGVLLKGWSFWRTVEKVGSPESVSWAVGTSGEDSEATEGSGGVWELNFAL